MSRAFIVSLDAILAVFVTLAFILASGFFIERTQYASWEDVILQSVAFDILCVADEQGILHSFMTKHGSVKPLFHLTPNGVCARLDVYDSSGSLFTSSSKAGCSDFAPTSTVAKRTFIYSNSIYLAEVLVWLK